MPRPEKVQAVAEIKERIDRAQAVFLAEYAGLSVKEQQTLRRELRSNEAEFKVVKMSLARRAAADLEIETLDEALLGPTGIAFADGDPVGAAKTLKDFAKDHEVFIIKGGLLGREYLSPERISQLADVEPRDVLLAKIAGAMKAPMANAASLFAALPRNAASMFQQLVERLEDEAPLPEEAASEPPPEASAAEAEPAEEAEPAPEAAAEEAPTESEEATEEPTPEDSAAETDADSADEPADESEESDDNPADEVEEEN
jgi:large subunit ribosomal protein L10